MRLATGLLATALLGGLASSAAAADTVRINAEARDCGLKNGTSATSSYCGDSKLYVGSASTRRQRSLLYFNVAGTLPANVEVTGATLHAYVAARTTTQAIPIEVRAMTRAWTSGATWNRASAGVPWTAAGGDYGASTVGATASASTVGQWLTWDVGSVVDEWGSDANNLGLMLKQANEGSAANELQLASATAGTIAQRPYLEITYRDAADQPVIDPMPAGMVFAGLKAQGGEWGLYRANVDGTNPRLVQRTPYNVWPALSPDGFRVAYAVYSSVYVLDLRTGFADEIPTNHCCPHPRWFPDGSRLIFGSDTGLQTVRPDGSEPKAITLALPPGVEPSTVWVNVSPNMKSLAFSAYVSDGPNLNNRAIFTANLDGSHVRRVTSSQTSYPGELQYSRDGRSLMYYSPPGSKIGVVGSNGSGDRTVASDLGHVFGLDWAPDNTLSISHEANGSGPAVTERVGLDGQRLGTMFSDFAMTTAVAYPQAADHSATLAHRFRPILRFDTSEPWRPLNVERFLDETFSDGQEQTRHQLCPNRGAPGGCTPWQTGLTTPSSMLDSQTVDPSTSDLIWPYIDVHGVGDEIDNFKSPRLAECVHGTLNDCDEGMNTSLYYHASGPYPEANYRFLDYWAFYRYNKFNIGDHEADWENVVVALPNEADPQDFAWVGMSAHGPVNRYLRSALHCDNDLDNGSCGWEDAPNGNDRPVVFVTNGSHANYPKRCDADLGGAATCPRVDQGTQVGEKGHDGERPWGANDDAGALEPIPAFARWRGWWGIKDGHSDVKSPGRQAPFDRPFAAECTDMWAVLESCSPASSRAAENATGDVAGTRDADPCAAWNGPGVAATVCDPVQLKASMASGELGTKAGPVVTANGAIQGQFTSSGGIAQIMGSTLDAGDELMLDTKLSAEAEVLIRFEDGGKMHRARFATKDIPSGRRTLRLKRGKARSITLAKPDGTAILPAEVETAP